MLYCNDGDWVESCTSMVEHKDGRLELLCWADKFERSTISQIEDLIGLEILANYSTTIAASAPQSNSSGKSKTVEKAA